MSTIAGAYYFDGRPVPTRDRAILGEVRAHVGGECAVLLDGPGLLMAVAPSRYEPARECEPARPPSGFQSTWDGRLDNRGADVTTGSAAIALQRYESGGIRGLSELIGDWSLAIWDPRSRSLLLASDFAGIRPLYYAHTERRVCWSSSIGLLARWTESDTLDEEFVGRFLVSRAVAGRSPYAGVLPVPPGHAVRFSAAGSRTEQFWRLPVERETVLGNDREYEERLLELFEESVQVRVSEQQTACAELSGGLDSSSVVSMSCRVLSTRKPKVFSHTHPGCSDEPFIQAMEQHCGIVSERLNMADFPLVTAHQTGGSAPGWWEPRVTEMARRMEGLGSGVLLTGQAGDFIMGNIGDDSEQVAGYLERGRLGAALGEAVAWSQATQYPVYSILWRAVRTTWFSYTAPDLPRGSALVKGPFTEVNSLSPKLQQMAGEPVSDRYGYGEWREAGPTRRRRFRMLAEMLENRSLQTAEQLRHLSCSHPYMHRPLVEYMMTIPPGQVCRPREPRRLMRRAFSSILPEKIARRWSKAAYAVSFDQALKPMARAMVENPNQMRMVELGYVEQASLLERLRRFIDGLDCNSTQLRQIVLFEFWLRNRERIASPQGTILEEIRAENQRES